MANSNDEEQPSFVPPFGYLPQPPMLHQMPSYPIIPQQWSPQWVMPPGMFPGLPTNQISQEYPSRYELVPRAQQTFLPNDDYMVNSLSRIYNNEDGSIEIERVKVHRLSGVNGQASLPSISSISTSAPSILSSKKPPPRRKRQKRLAQGLKHESRSEYTVQMPYMQYGYPYPYGYIPFMTPPIYPMSGLNPSEGRDSFGVRTNIDQSVHEEGCDKTGQQLQTSPQNPDKSSSSSTTHFEKSLENLSSAPPIPKKSIRVHHENPYANEQIQLHYQSTTTNTDLLYAFKKLEKNVNNFKDHLIEMQKEKTETSLDKNSSEENDGRYSETSTLVVDNQSQSAQSLTDTDSTEISFSSDDEDELSHDDGFEYQWILLEKRHMEEDLNATCIQQIRLWRKQLVDVLCNGLGLDDADWTIFQLLVKERVPINDKIELINAGKISLINNNVGVALLRNSLLQVIKYGEMILKPVEEREGCWKCIRADGDQPWTQVKGCLEILHVFGYRLNGRNLIYHKKSHTKQETIAKLTIDILILAEEFRLYLTGVHAAPQEITKLFTEEVEADQSTAMESFSEVNLRSSTVALDDSTIPVHETSGKPQYENTEEVIKMLEDEHSTNRDKRFSSPSPVEEKSSLVKVETTKDNSSNETKIVKVEDHVYEEIEEVKSKVEEIKKSQPPPLPPKSKRRLMILRNSKSSDSPELETAKMNANVNETGSLCSRQRKRRAPMPPSFSEEVIDGKEVKGMSVLEYSPERSSKPLTLPPKTKRKSNNPFYEEDIKPTGFIGKNPFYEDVDGKHTETKDQATSTESLPVRSGAKRNIALFAPDRSKNVNVHSDQVPYLPINQHNSETTDAEKTKNSENLNPNTKENCQILSEKSSASTKSSVLEENSHQASNLSNKEKNEVQLVSVRSKMNDKISIPESTDQLEGSAEKNNSKTLQDKSVTDTKEYHAIIRENSPQLTIMEHKGNEEISNNSNSTFVPIQDSNKVAENMSSVKEDQGKLTGKLTSPMLVRTIESMKDKMLDSSSTEITAGREKEVPTLINAEVPPSDASGETISCSSNASTPPTLPPKAILKLMDDIPYIDTNLSQENSESQCSVDSGIGGEKMKAEKPSVGQAHHVCPPLPPPPPSTSPPPSCPPSPTTPPPVSENSSSSSLVPFPTETWSVEKVDTKQPVLELLDVDIISDDVKRMSLHKEEWVFPNKQRAGLTVEELTRSSSPSDSGGYEIPENPNRLQEEMNGKKSLLEKNSTTEHRSKHPLPPLRSKRTKHAPPRPPKPKEDPAPSLPPKGIANSKSLSSKLKTFPAAFAKNRAPIKWKHKTFSILRQGCQKPNDETAPETLNMKETRSTPPSPQLTSSERRQTLGNDRTRRSWPSILCECMDANRTDNAKS